jgi:hypothetical protein
MIKRYEPVDYTTEQHKYGRFVRYSDHTATINQARIDAVREFAEAIEKECNAIYATSEDACAIMDFIKSHIEQLKEQGE